MIEGTSTEENNRAGNGKSREQEGERKGDRQVTSRVINRLELRAGLYKIKVPFV